MGYIFYGIGSLLRLLKNALRSLRKAPDYVTFVLEGEYPAVREPRKSFIQRRVSPAKLSLDELDKRFELIGKTKKVKGVVIHLRRLDMPVARMQTLRNMLAKLQAAGKEVVVWASNFDTKTYYVACQADRIMLQPGGTIAPMGFVSSTSYVAAGLEKLGLKFEAVQISPYKSAADRLVRTSMSKEVRKMQDWLLDSQYHQLLEAIGQGRNVDEKQAARMVDESPYTHKEALEQQLVDEVIGEEDLPNALKSGEKPARLQTWAQARGKLKLPAFTPPGGYIAMIRIQGSIVDGKSSQPPFPSPLPIPFLFSKQAGDQTVVHLARRALRDSRAKALLVYIDSGGGSATSSEAMHAALAKVAAKKPVVALMDTVAASGGYYVATPGQWIVAQPGTITGSIGVLTGKVINKDMLSKLSINRESLSRGANADMEAPFASYSKKQKEKVWAFINNVYEIFLQRVSDSRQLSVEDVDKVGGGRVWTGAQALEHGLIDQLGGLPEALEKIRELAGVKAKMPLVELVPPKSPAAMQQAPTAAYAMEKLKLLQTSEPLCICPIEWLR